MLLSKCQLRNLLEINFLTEIYSYLSEHRKLFLKTVSIFSLINDFVDLKGLSSSTIKEDTLFMHYLALNMHKVLNEINSATMIKNEVTR